jgi:hypothetical protein
VVWRDELVVVVMRWWWRWADGEESGLRRQDLGALGWLPALLACSRLLAERRLCGEVQLRLCLVCILVCADVYCACYHLPLEHWLLNTCDAILLPAAVSSICLPAWWWCLNARLLLSNSARQAARGQQLSYASQSDSRRYEPSTLAQTLPLDTGHCLLTTSVYSVPSHTATLQHMPAHASITQHALSYALASA